MRKTSIGDAFVVQKKNIKAVGGIKLGTRHDEEESGDGGSSSSNSIQRKTKKKTIMKDVSRASPPRHQ